MRAWGGAGEVHSLTALRTSRAFNGKKRRVGFLRGHDASLGSGGEHNTLSHLYLPRPGGDVASWNKLRLKS